MQKLFLIFSFLSLWSLSQAGAQIEMQIKTHRNQFIIHEPLVLDLNITNRAGKELFLHQEGLKPWLNIIVTNSKGTPLTPLKKLNFKAVKIPSGRALQKSIDLAQLFPLDDYGSYKVYAMVRLPGQGREGFNSNTAKFIVTTARIIASQHFGIGANLREYKLMSFTDEKQNSLYFALHDKATDRNLKTYTLGPALTFERPKTMVDGKNNFNILYLVKPNIYAHLVINSKGVLKTRRYHQRGAYEKPKLVAFANGEVKVSGSIPFDPNAKKEKRKGQRKISDRPGIIYR